MCAPGYVAIGGGGGGGGSLDGGGGGDGVRPESTSSNVCGKVRANTASNARLNRRPCATTAYIGLAVGMACAIYLPRV